MKPGRKLDPNKDFMELMDQAVTQEAPSQPKRKSQFDSFNDLKNLRESYESTQTSISFLLVLLSLIFNLFIILSLLAITGMSIASEDNLEKLLHETPTTIDLRQSSVLFIFVIMAAVCALSVRLIFYSYQEEIWFYTRPSMNGKTLLKCFFCGQLCSMALQNLVLGSCHNVLNSAVAV